MNNKSKIYIFKILEAQVGMRLDKAISELWTNHSRSEIARLISLEAVLVNHEVKKPAYKVELDDEIRLTYTPETMSLTAEDIPLNIVYEDEDLLILNKPIGLVVHPAPGHKGGTLVNALLHYGTTLSNLNGDFRPGIVHRLDKNTSGILVVAKNNFTHAFLAKQFQKRTVVREYLALVEGVIKENKGLIDAPIGRDEKDRQKMGVNVKKGKQALTEFEVLRRFASHTLLKCSLKTGRTHQIRVHLAYIRYPVVGDTLYGGKTAFYKQGQWLMAHSLTFVHPRTQEKRTFTVPLSSSLEKVLENKNL